MLLNLLKIDRGNPSISIYNCKEHIIDVDAISFEEYFFKMLGTPRDVRGFPFLLKLF